LPRTNGGRGGKGGGGKKRRKKPCPRPPRNRSAGLGVANAAYLEEEREGNSDCRLPQPEECRRRDALGRKREAFCTISLISMRLNFRKKGEKPLVDLVAMRQHLIRYPSHPAREGGGEKVACFRGIEPWKKEKKGKEKCSLIFDHLLHHCSS